MTISKRQRNNRVVGSNYPNLGLNGVPKSKPKSAPVAPRPTPTATNSEIASGSIRPSEDMGVSGAKESKEEVGVGSTFSKISSTHRLLMKQFDRPKRFFNTPTWNSTVSFLTTKEPGAGTFYNTHTTYAEWYTGLSIAAMFDDLVLYWGLIVKGALPSIWPNGPAQAILEAKNEGIHISANGLLNPGKDFYVWMINGKVREWIRGYLEEKYPEGINID